MLLSRDRLQTSPVSRLIPFPNSNVGSSLSETSRSAPNFISRNLLTSSVLTFEKLCGELMGIRDTVGEMHERRASADVFLHEIHEVTAP